LLFMTILHCSVLAI